jgi:altronate dehydratase
MSASAFDAMVLDATDDVGVTLRDTNAGETLRVRASARLLTITLRDAVPLGHKFALHDCAAGASLRKYGEVIGAARAAIAAGAHVHVHNLTSLRGRRAS